MRRVAVLLGAMLLVLAFGAPVLAAEPAVPATDQVLISIEGNVTLPAGERAAAVIVIQGDALIAGDAQAVFVLGGTATLQGAVAETLTVIDGRAVLEAGTTVGDVLQLNSTIERADGVVVSGAIRSLADDLAGFALFLGFAALAFWIGGLLVSFVAALALAAFAARQVRTAEAIISREPLKAFLVGLAMIVLPPIVLIALAATIVGLPLALTVLFFVWPTLAFVGYLVAAIWVGEWLLRSSGRAAAERPYLASVVGLILVGLLSLVPLVAAIASIFGLGAVTVAGWRTLVGRSGPRPTFQPQPSPSGA
jgi:hypothetical protein